MTSDVYIVSLDKMPKVWTCLWLGVLLMITTVKSLTIGRDNEVYVSDEIKDFVTKTLTGEKVRYFVKEPLQSVEFQCKNRATKKVLSSFPNSVIRWLHNGDNITVRPARMRLSINSLIIQNLLPEDSGVYFCVVMVTPDQPIVTAIYSLVVGENWIHVYQKMTLKLICNSKELGTLYKSTVRTWNHNLMKDTAPAIKNEAIFYGVDEKYNGTWTCSVTDTVTNRIWITAKYRVIVDPPPTFIKRVKILVKENRYTSLAIIMGVIFIIMVIYQALADRFSKKNEQFKKEMDFFKRVMKVDAPATGQNQSFTRRK